MSRDERRKRGKIVGGFVALPNSYLRTPQFAALSGRAVKLLLEVCLQYNGKNNGGLMITRDAMRTRGFKSASQQF